MNLNFVVGVMAATALFLPVVLVLSGRLFINTSLLALAVYYSLTCFYCLMALGILPQPAPAQQFLSALINYFDTPLMLVILLFFCNEAWKRKLVLTSLSVFIIFEIAIALLTGFSRSSSTYILGPGILLVLCFSVFFFAHYGKLTIAQGKNTGKTLMLVATVFAYGCFLVIYCLHYLWQTSAVSDVFLLYYIVLFVSALTMSSGLWWILVRSRKIKELQLTRRELALFFDS